MPVAAKELKKTCTEKEEIAFMREAFIISQFNHPNIVKVLGVVLTGQPVCGGGRDGRGREEVEKGEERWVGGKGMDTRGWEEGEE
jgi:hypothetical protein